MAKIFPDRIEEFDARAIGLGNTSGKHSLEWQAAKAVNKYNIPVPDYANEDFKKLLETSKKYSK